MPDSLQVVAEAIKRAGDATGATLRVALCTAVQVGTGKVQTDATGAAWVACDLEVTPAPGDRVYALQQGSVTLVVGRLTGATEVIVQPPVGAVTPYAGTAAPANWLVCDGALLLRADYASLFAVIGTTYGNTLSTNFRVPDMRGRGPLGVNGSHALGSSGGNETVTLTGAMTPTHTHPGSQTAHSHPVTVDPHGHTASQAGHDHGAIGSHSHSVTKGAGTVAAASGTAVTASNATATTSGAAGGHTHTSVSPGVTVDAATATAAAGSSTPAVTVGSTAAPTASVPVLSPFLAMPYIIRAL